MQYVRKCAKSYEGIALPIGAKKACEEREKESLTNLLYISPASFSFAYYWIRTSNLFLNRTEQILARPELLPDPNHLLSGEKRAPPLSTRNRKCTPEDIRKPNFLTQFVHQSILTLTLETYFRIQSRLIP